MSHQPEANPTTFPCHDPATGEYLGEAPILNADAVQEEIGRARAAQVRWAKTTIKERKRVLRALMNYLLDHADELCEVACRDAGKTMNNAMIGELWPVVEKIRWTLSNGEQALRRRKVSTGPLMHKRAFVEYHPLGVIGIITPWNFPLQNIVGPTISSLFTGNGTVVKVSEWVSWSAPRYQRMFDEVLTSCGHSPDLVRIITGDGATGAALVSGGVQRIVFTGSRRNGERVVAGSASSVIPVVLELGGKDPMIVCDDAHLEQAACAAVAGSFLTAGQMCMATERVIVHAGIYDEFVARVVEIASGLTQGPPFEPIDGRPPDVGSMTMPAQADIVESLVNDALQKGARALVGGTRNGNFFAPTVLVDIQPSMRIMNEETFGPVLCISKVPNDEQAIALANSTNFGLSSSVFTKDVRRMRIIGQQLKAGSTIQNDFGLGYMVQSAPFGGVAGSGFGRLNGPEGLRGCCNQKAVVEDRLPLGLPAKLFPVMPGDTERIKQVVELLYRPSFGARLSALWALIRGSRGPRE